MKHAITTFIVSVGAVCLLCLLFVAALVETLIRGKRSLDCGLEEDET